MGTQVREAALRLVPNGPNSTRLRGAHVPMSLGGEGETGDNLRQVPSSWALATVRGRSLEAPGPWGQCVGGPWALGTVCERLFSSWGL